MFSKIPRLISFPEISLKSGRNISITIIAIKTASILIKTDSVINCLTSCDLLEPSVFLMPTSFALFSDLAVARLIKFIQAIRRIAKAITEKI